MFKKKKIFSYYNAQMHPTYTTLLQSTEAIGAAYRT